MVQLVGAGAVGDQGQLFVGTRFGVFLRDDIQLRQSLQQDGVRLLGDDLEGGIVNLNGFLDGIEVGKDLRAVVGADDPVYGEYGVIHGEILTLVEFYAFADLKLPGQLVNSLVFGGQAGFGLQRVAIQLEQGLKHGPGYAAHIAIVRILGVHGGGLALDSQNDFGLRLAGGTGIRCGAGVSSAGISVAAGGLSATAAAGQKTDRQHADQQDA